VIVFTNFQGGMLSDKTLIRDLAHVIVAHDYFARDAAGRLFRYDAGVYTENAELYVKRQVKQLTITFGNAGRWNRNLALEVIEYIALDAPELVERPDLERINLINGILDVQTGELFPHSPAFRTPVRIPITYDGAASSPAIEEFIQQVFPQDSLELAWEILGDLITADRSIQKAICVVGEGGNGKSAFCQLCTNFVGEHNVVHLSLQKLENDRFAPARLYGRLANICPDLPGSHLEDSAIFKAITGGDRITGELKYRDPFEFRPCARLIFSANHFPAARYGTQSYFDRWLLIPFERRFRGSRKDIPRGDLDAQLSAHRELSGALNRSLPALRRLRKNNRFSETNSVMRTSSDFEGVSDPFRGWLEAETMRTSSSSTSQRMIYAAYARASMLANRSPMTKQMFGRLLKRYIPGLHEFQKTVDGERQWMYGGIELRGQTLNEPILGRKNGHQEEDP
jgi:putative DNA primase/helicase